VLAVQEFSRLSGFNETVVRGRNGL